jgi:hypothetical protein
MDMHGDHRSLAGLIALWHALPTASNMARPPAKIFGGGAA